MWWDTNSCCHLTKNSDCLIIHSFHGWHESLVDSFATVVWNQFYATLMRMYQHKPRGWKWFKCLFMSKYLLSLASAVETFAERVLNICFHSEETVNKSSKSTDTSRNSCLDDDNASKKTNSPVFTRCVSGVHNSPNVRQLLFLTTAKKISYSAVLKDLFHNI